MKVKIKRLTPNSVIPSYAKSGDAGMDLTATSKFFDEYGNICYGVGLAFEIPEGYVGLLFPRSSIYKQDLFLTNSVGVIDSGYRGEITFKFKPVHFDIKHHYQVGDRIGQLIIIPYPDIEFVEADELSDSERGEGGYGSSGR